MERTPISPSPFFHFDPYGPTRKPQLRLPRADLDPTPGALGGAQALRAVRRVPGPGAPDSDRKIAKQHPQREGSSDSPPELSDFFPSSGKNRGESGEKFNPSSLQFGLGRCWDSKMTQLDLSRFWEWSRAWVGLDYGLQIKRPTVTCGMSHFSGLEHFSGKLKSLAYVLDSPLQCLASQ